MEYLIILIVCLVFLITLKFAWGIRIKEIKKIKEIGYSKQLNEITNKLPENKQICEAILKKLDNESVKIQQTDDKQNKTSLYIAVSNTIFIANIKDSFTRVQTIAHECLHSIQNRRTLLFNFIFSNLYFLYFIAICILSILKMNPFPELSIFVLLILSFVYYAVRSYLEMDAMLNAKPLAKEYMQQEGSLSKEEQEKILENYEVINQIGIKLTNFSLLMNSTLKVMIYTIIAWIFS